MNTLKRAIILICLFVPIFVIGQDRSLNFAHLSLENGLSQSSVTCILKDSQGYMWFGTEDGLNKFDGNDFIVYRHKPSDTKSLSSSYINTVVEADDGFLWIGTKNGLNYFNPDTEEFTRYTHEPNDTRSISHNEINALLISDNKELLIGTSNGLNKFDSENKFYRYEIKDSKSPYYIKSIEQDEDGQIWVLSTEMLGIIKLNSANAKVIFQKHLENTVNNTILIDSLNIWIGTSKGLLRFNKLNEEYNTFKFYGLNDKRDGVLSIIKSQKDTLLLGTLGGGLISFDISTSNFSRTLHDPVNPLSLNSNGIRSLFLDESNILWLGTFGRGINKQDPNQFKFQHYKHALEDKNSLSESTVRSILKDRDGELWIGTHDGLNRLNRETNEIRVHKYDQSNNSTISSNTVRALSEDSNGIIWAGTWENGLNSFDKKTGRFKRFINLPNSNDPLGPVQALAIDSNDNIWIGGKGLWHFNPETNEHKSYFIKNSNDVLESYRIYSLYFDTTQSLWLGTYLNGLSQLNTKSGRIKKYVHQPTDSLSLSHNHVTSIAEDKKGSLWVGTYGGGLNRLDVSTGTFEHYNTSNGLLNDVVYGVLVDSQDHVWFTSNAGLSKLVPLSHQFIHYGLDYGIQSKEFNAGAYHKSQDGEFFFGGINGFNAFYPNTIDKDKKVAQIVFTDFLLLDDEGIQNSNKLFDKSISRSEYITLNYNQNNFSLKFSELNYSNTNENNYEYQLEGQNDNWHNLGTKRIITLGNLKSGKYSVNVRVHNELTKKTTLHITILPPYWRTGWAYLLYVIIILLSLALLYNSKKKNQNIRKQFELKIRNLENDIITSKHIQNGNNINALPVKQIKAESINQKFLQRAIQIVEENMENSDFDVEKFAEEMFISRSQLYRRLRALTGHSTSKFIRLIRLKRAAQLLAAKSGTVTEIAYKVGFDNMGYFSKCFTETFGKPPSKYEY